MSSASLAWCPGGRRGGTRTPLVDEGQVTGKPTFDATSFEAPRPTTSVIASAIHRRSSTIFCVTNSPPMSGPASCARRSILPTLRTTTRSTDALSRRRCRRGGGAAWSVWSGCLARFRRERLAKHRRPPAGEIGRRSGRGPDTGQLGIEVVGALGGAHELMLQRLHLVLERHLGVDDPQQLLAQQRCLASRVASK